MGPCTNFLSRPARAFEAETMSPGSNREERERKGASEKKKRTTMGM